MPEPELELEQIQQLEATLFAARNFVRPSDDLRPRTLEMARESTTWQIHANRLAGGLLCILLVWSSLLAVSSGLAVYRKQLVGPFPAEIENAAVHNPTNNPYQRDWGLVDAFQESRSLQKTSYSSAENISSDVR